VSEFILRLAALVCHGHTACVLLHCCVAKHAQEDCDRPMCALHISDQLRGMCACILAASTPNAATRNSVGCIYATRKLCAKPGGGGRVLSSPPPPPLSSPPPLPPHFHPNLTDQNTPCHCSSITAIVLQGVAASISTLQGGKICTPTVKAASLASILQAVVTSGMEF